MTSTGIERIPLPEQFLLLTHDPKNFRPEYDPRVTEDIVLMTIIWELCQAEVLAGDNDLIMEATAADLTPPYLQQTLEFARESVPLTIWRLLGNLTIDLRPVRTRVDAQLAERGYVQVQQNLLQRLINTRTTTLTDLGCQAIEELKTHIMQALRTTATREQCAQLLQEQPRLFTLLVIMEHHRYTEPLLGYTHYPQYDKAMLRYMDDLLEQWGHPRGFPRYYTPEEHISEDLARDIFLANLKRACLEEYDQILWRDDLTDRQKERMLRALDTTRAERQ